MYNFEINFHDNTHIEHGLSVLSDSRVKWVVELKLNIHIANHITFIKYVFI